MAISTLWLADFRCFTDAEFRPDPEGLTVLRGANGAGKTSVLEAVGWLATQRSIRGATRDALVRTGTDRAVVRAEARWRARRAHRGRGAGDGLGAHPGQPPTACGGGPTGRAPST